MIQTNNKPITTKHTDVNRALQDIYNIVNKLASSVNTQSRTSSRIKGDLGDLRVNDNGFQYHNGKGWQTIALAADNEQYTPVVTNALQSSGITYPIADGTVGQSIITDGSKKLSFESHLPLTGGTLTGNLKLSSAVSARPIFTIENTFTGATSGGITFLKNKGAAGVDDDDIGSILFTSDNTEQELTDFAKIIAEVSEATDGDEAGRLSFLVAESTDSTSELTAGLVLEGEHATDGEVDVTIAAGAASMTTVAGNLTVTGDLDVDGNDITTPGTLNITPGIDCHIDPVRNLILDHGAAGGIQVQKNGTEYSVANSGYAGIILGYTTVGIDAADDSYPLTGTMTCLDDALKVNFVAPPSGAVEIFAQVYFEANRRLPVLGLSDRNATATYRAISFPNTTDETNEHIQAEPPTGYGDSVLRPHWVVTGLTAGTTYEWWLGAKVSAGSSGGTLRWGGNATNKYPPFIMKATALPNATADYAVYG